MPANSKKSLKKIDVLDYGDNILNWLVYYFCFFIFYEILGFCKKITYKVVNL